MIQPCNHFISIIVPVYNAEELLPRCINSLLAQSYSRIEIILIDDGSSDGSGYLCDKFASIDNRVRVIHQANAGVSTARNKGMSLATGDFLCFVDADDEVEPNYISSFVQGITPEVDLVFQGFCEIRDGHCIRWTPPEQHFAEGELTEAISLLNKQSVHLFGYVYTKLYRRSIIQENSLAFRQDISLTEDRIFALEYLIHARQMQLVSTSAYRYYIQPNSLTTRRRSYEECQFAADTNLQAAEALLQKQPSAQFLRDTHYMHVLYSTEALIVLLRDSASLSSCICAFRRFRRQALNWLPLYSPTILTYKVLKYALFLPSPLGAAFMKTYWFLKRLKHQQTA